jgi:hypothetical protein
MAASKIMTNTPDMKKELANRNFRGQFGRK